MDSQTSQVETDPVPSYKKTGRAIKKNKVLNKAPSDLQITAEQILREAYEHRVDEVKRRAQKISNIEELKSYQMRKRIEFEDNLRRQPHSINTWLRYAKFEDSQQEWERARSIFERALNIDYQNRTIWLKYTDFELRNKFANHARNVWDRAVQLLPRTDQFWYKYALMEEKLGNVEKARSVFERWMKWNPPATAWESYIKLEMRCGGRRLGKIARARKIWSRFCLAHETLPCYLKWAKFELKFGNIEETREVFTIALKELGEEAYELKFFTAFAEFEKKAKETERVRSIYKFALDHVPKFQAEKLYEEYTAFERQAGSRTDIDGLVLSKNRFVYESKLQENPTNYDVWFDYLKMQEAAGDTDRVFELYERAIAALPPVEGKSYWRRYIFLWVKYAFFAELRAKDPARTREIFKACLNLVPHAKFTFAKIWLLFAEFEIRQKDVAAARSILGKALGVCPKERLFKGYIELETKMLEIDRCRTLYEKLLEFASENCAAWEDYAAMEAALGENNRCRAIFELGISQKVLDMPEQLWTKYIDYEAEQKNKGKVVQLFERLLDRSKNAKVWCSYAQTLMRLGGAAEARGVFAKGDEFFRGQGAVGREPRQELLLRWVAAERDLGAEAEVDRVQRLLPREVKRLRRFTDQAGQPQREEFVDLVFPDEDNAQKAHLKLLEMAHKWKKAAV